MLNETEKDETARSISEAWRRQRSTAQAEEDRSDLDRAIAYLKANSAGAAGRAPSEDEDTVLGLGKGFLWIVEGKALYFEDTEGAHRSTDTPDEIMEDYETWHKTSEPKGALLFFARVWMYSYLIAFVLCTVAGVDLKIPSIIVLVATAAFGIFEFQLSKVRMREVRRRMAGPQFMQVRLGEVEAARKE